MTHKLKKVNPMFVRQGDVRDFDFGPKVDPEKNIADDGLLRGCRPVIVLQKFAGKVIVLPLTKNPVFNAADFSLSLVPDIISYPRFEYVQTVSEKAFEQQRWYGNVIDSLGFIPFKKLLDFHHKFLTGEINYGELINNTYQNLLIEQHEIEKSKKCETAAVIEAVPVSMETVEMKPAVETTPPVDNWEIKMARTISLFSKQSVNYTGKKTLNKFQRRQAIKTQIRDAISEDNKLRERVGNKKQKQTTTTDKPDTATKKIRILVTYGEPLIRKQLAELTNSEFSGIYECSIATVCNLRKVLGIPSSRRHSMSR